MNPRDLKRFAPLAELSEEELELLDDLLEPQTLRAGQPLLREGSEGEGLLLLVEGVLRAETEREGVLGRLEPGAVLGGLSLASVGPRAMTLVAEEPAEVRVLTRTAFHRLTEDAPRAACRILEAILRDLAGTLRGGLDPLRG